MLRIMSLNIWRYHDWANRKDNIIDAITGFSPDCIGLQEIQTNLAFSSRPQSDVIADECGYKYRVFAPAYRLSGQIDREGNSTQDTSYGLAFLSKHPIVSSESYFLKQHPDYTEPCTILFVTVDINGDLVELCNVHFGNRDLFADLHLNELMDLCERRKRFPIILGDFNHFNLAYYTPTRLKRYTLSSDIAKYESMPKNKGTLDYVIVPKVKFTIDSVICPTTYLSDHRTVIADITPL
jgi:endonuclease/exonuclease/phosphatase family metal-dependent hydrolase